MLKVTRTDSQLLVKVTTERRPLIYLDQCALYEVAKHNDVGRRFRQLFSTSGELLLSSINMFELGQLQGDSLERAKRLLDDVIGLAWTPIEFDPAIVIEREHYGHFSPSPAICERLVEDVCSGRGEPSMSKLLDAARHSDEDKRHLYYAKGELQRQIMIFEPNTFKTLAVSTGNIQESR